VFYFRKKRMFYALTQIPTLSSEIRGDHSCYGGTSSSPGRSAKGGGAPRGARLQGGEAPRGRSATGRWNPLGATERLEATTVTSWSGQTRGGWTMVPAQGPLADGGWCEGWLVDYASTGTPRVIEEDDVRVFCEARGGGAIVPTQGPLGNKSSR
jgi:hypothetical protein